MSAAVPPLLADDDHEPLVVVSDAAFAALPPAIDLGNDAQNYMRAQGITDERTWAAFRLEQIDAVTFARLGFTGKRLPKSEHGISIPTFDPRQPDTITGIIRQCYGLNQHRLVTAPVGLAGAVDLNDQPRIVLTKTPLTALRLYQAGVHDVALVEDPVALIPLRDWFSTRAIVLAVHKRAEIEILRAALGPAGVLATSVVLSMAPGQLREPTRALLGAAAPEPVEVPPITPLLLRDLHDLARKQLDTDAATVSLGLLEIASPDLVHAYGLGFLPPDVADILPRDARRALSGVRLGRSIIAPAYDDQGLIVDLFIVHAHEAQRTVGGCFDQPRGLLAPAISRGTADIIVTDTFRWLTRLFTEGYRNVVLVRDVADAQVNAARLAAAGVQRVCLRVRCNHAAYTTALRSAGLAVEEVRAPVESLGVAVVPISVADILPAADVTVEPAPEAPPVPDAEPAVPAAVITAVEEPEPAMLPAAVPTVAVEAVAAPAPAPVAPAPSLAVPAPSQDVLRFVEEDRTAEVAIYEIGPVRYAVEMRDDGDTRRRITVRAHGQSTQDRFDLASAVQRDRFTGNAARRVGLPVATIGTHLLALLAAIQTREEAQHHTPAMAVADADRAEAEAFLARPDLLDGIAADCIAMGSIGEERAQILLYLTAISRCLPDPLWAVYRAQAGAAPWQALGCIAALVPPEDRTVLHHVTGARLGQLDPRSLRHRLLIIDRAETLRPEAALALRVLHERGGLGWATATSGAEPGPGPLPSDARGPVAVLAAAAADLDLRCRDSFLSVTVDESPEQTARVLAAQNRRHGGVTEADTAAIIRRHHAAQRLLARLPVVIPFADRIVFPVSRVRNREEHAWFLGLIATLAFLHQRQRARSPSGAILASEADYTAAVRLTDGLLGASRAGISAPAQRMLATLVRRQLATFTMADLAGLLPDGTRYTFRAALQDLCDFGLVSAGPRSDSGRGRLRQYTVMSQTAQASTGIRLRPVDATIIDAAEAAPATLAVVGERHFANESPEVACG
jgi:hypothetical protein